MITRQNLYETIAELGLQPRAEALVAVATPAIAITTSESNDAIVAVGESKIGGLPDIDERTQWPTWNGTPLTFVAQVNLLAATALDFDNLLPTKGLLSFFYEASAQPRGFRHSDSRSWRVLYHNDLGTLKRRAAPPELTERPLFQTHAVSFSEALTFPDPESPAGTGLAFAHEHHERERMWNLYDRSVIPCHMLGHPNVVQHAMELQCQLTSNGIDTGLSQAYSSREALQFANGASDWRLLLQVPSIGEMEWGDAGVIYYWMPRSALATHDYSRAWLLLQDD